MSYLENWQERSTWNYLPKYTSNTLISLGETPLILDAWEMVDGLIAPNFSRASIDNEDKGI